MAGERRPPGPGDVRGAITTHPVDERPAVWVRRPGGWFPGREHARGNGGRSVEVLVDVRGLQHLEWFRADAVEPRGETPTCDQCGARVEKAEQHVVEPFPSPPHDEARRVKFMPPPTLTPCGHQSSMTIRA